MIVIRVMGGLGNQLFQYALYELLVQKGKEVCLDVSHYSEEEGKGDKRPLDLDLFSDISFEKCSEKRKYKYLDESNSFWNKVRRKLGFTYRNVIDEVSQYMPEIFELTEGYLEGYWNSERYSGQIERLLWSKLKFPTPTDSRTTELAQKLIAEDSVSVHIRRGDYIKPENQELFGGICTEQYYNKAIELVKEKIDNPRFYIFCDDTEYVRAHITESNVCIVDWNTGRNSIYDMYLMSRCRANICANSTFSVWASKLNSREDRIRIRPERLDNAVVQGEEEIKALLDNQWILINSEGKEIV